MSEVYKLENPEFRTHLKNIKQEEWQELFDIIDEIDNTTVFYEENPNKGEMDFIIDSPVVNSFHGLAYKMSLVVSFDWSGWDEGREIIQNKNANYDEFDIITLLKLITAILRSNRFCDGVLGEAFESGLIRKLILGIKHQVEKGALSQL